MVRVTGDIDIDRPPAVVFDFVADERNEPKFNRRMTAVSLVSGVAGTLVARYTATMTSLRPVIMTIECTDRPRRLASVSTTSGVDIAGALTFRAERSGTRPSWPWGLRQRGPAKLAAPLISWFGARQERTIWTALKAYLESKRGAHAAAWSGSAPVVTASAGDDAVGV